MKKLLTVLLALMLMLGLAACGESAPDPTIVPSEDAPVAEAPANEPTPGTPQEQVPAEPEPEAVAAGPMYDPLKVYFHDTYGQIRDNPSIMWGDLSWNGWFDVMTPLTDEGDKWFSFVMPSSEIADNYNMLIFFNGLPDEDPDSIQWVWNFNRGYPSGNYFIADFVRPVNPPDLRFMGEQRDATSFATLEQAEAGIKNVIH
ncbi:MAG: hypothetical protein FWD48_02545 [Oscillospiraceae bacterium]|nr:hypothetical protein [Oscillospiraceae bacterium]